MDSKKRIVIGIGDRGYIWILQWTLKMFNSDGVTLDLIHCIPGRLPTELPYSNESEFVEGRRIVDRAAAFSRAGSADVITEVLEGFAGDLLVERSEDADLLIIGSSRAHPVFRVPSASVVRHCVRRASCPIAIVPVGNEEMADREVTVNA